MTVFKSKRLSLVLLLASSSIAMVVQAGQNTTANTVTGRAPVATAVGLTSAPTVGATVSAAYTFSDADNDAESTTAFQWYRNGAVLAGATGPNLLLNQSGIGGDSISVQVTPRTNPALTDPWSGIAVMSASAKLPAGSFIARFATPSSTSRGWGQAESYCSGLGSEYRLPTREELQNLFGDATRSPTFSPNSDAISNVDMCTEHRWPLSGQCSGGTNRYWSSTTGIPGYHYGVDLSSGAAGSYTSGASDSYNFLVTCIK